MYVLFHGVFPLCSICVFTPSTVWMNQFLTKHTKNSIIYSVLETAMTIVLTMATVYAIPILLMVSWNREKPNSREAVAIDPELRSSKRHA